MLGAPCSPCCSCTAERAYSLWQSLLKKDWSISLSMAIPKCDAATIANWAYSQSDQVSQPYDLAQDVDRTINGYTYPPTAFYPDGLRKGSTLFWEGHDSYGDATLSLALDVAASTWNAIASSGVVKAVYTTWPYSIALTITVSASSGECNVLANASVSVRARSASANYGAGNISQPAAQVVTHSFDPFARVYALVSAPIYKLEYLNINQGMNNVLPGIETIYKMVGITNTLSLTPSFAVVSAAWAESRKPSDIPWGNYAIIDASIQLNSSQLVESGTLSGSWSGPWSGAPQRWVPRTFDTNWTSGLALSVLPNGNAELRFWGTTQADFTTAGYELVLRRNDDGQAYLAVGESPLITAQATAT